MPYTTHVESGKGNSLIFVGGWSAIVPSFSATDQLTCRRSGPAHSGVAIGLSRSPGRTDLIKFILSAQGMSLTHPGWRVGALIALMCSSIGHAKDHAPTQNDAAC